jgi:hypothetical protein
MAAFCSYVLLFIITGFVALCNGSACIESPSRGKQSIFFRYPKSGSTFRTNEVVEIQIATYPPCSANESHIDVAKKIELLSSCIPSDAVIRFFLNGEWLLDVQASSCPQLRIRLSTNSLSDANLTVSSSIFFRSDRTLQAGNGDQCLGGEPQSSTSCAAVSGAAHPTMVAVTWFRVERTSTEDGDKQCLKHQDANGGASPEPAVHAADSVLVWMGQVGSSHCVQSVRFRELARTVAKSEK